MTSVAPPPTPAACARWLRQLTEAESCVAGAPSDDPLTVDLAGLREHAHACPVCARRHGARLDALHARVALRSRSIPDGLLDGFYDNLEAEARMAPLGGGMSLAFLDAPRALRAWRTAAVTAGLLLAVGVAWVATREAPPTTLADRPLRVGTDPRTQLIPAWDAPSERSVQVRPAADGFFRDHPKAVPASLVVPSRRD